MAAALGLGGVKGIAVAIGQRGDDGGGGVARLDIDLARLFAAPGAPRHLRDLLIGPLARAQIAAFKAKVGVDHPHQLSLIHI